MRNKEQSGTDIGSGKKNRRIEKLGGAEARWNSEPGRRRGGGEGSYRQRRRRQGLEFGNTRASPLSYPITEASAHGGGGGGGVVVGGEEAGERGRRHE